MTEGATFICVGKYGDKRVRYRDTLDWYEPSCISEARNRGDAVSRRLVYGQAISLRGKRARMRGWTNVSQYDRLMSSSGVMANDWSILFTLCTFLPSIRLPGHPRSFSQIQLKVELKWNYCSTFGARLLFYRSRVVRARIFSLESSKRIRIWKETISMKTEYSYKLR